MKHLTETAERALSWITGLTLFAMMWLTFIDVTGRDLFNTPIQGAFEITQLLLAILVFTALPIVTGREEHVSISLVEQALGGRVKKVQRVAVCLIGMTGVGYMSLMIWRLGDRLARYGDYTAYLKLELAPFAYLMAALGGVSSAILLFLAVRYLATPSDRLPRGPSGGAA